MMDRLTLLRVIFPTRRAALARARRWARAAQHQPDLARDLVELSGLYANPAVYIDPTGEVRPDPVDPIRMAREVGEQTLARKLLALMGVTPEELNILAQEQSHDFD